MGRGAAGACRVDGEVCSTVLGECAGQRGAWTSLVTGFHGKQVSYLQDFLEYANDIDFSVRHCFPLVSDPM